MRPLFALLSLATFLPAAEVKPVKWSGSLNVPDPTSVTFDEAGNAYAGLSLATDWNFTTLSMPTGVDLVAASDTGATSVTHTVTSDR